jgi:uncharacterized Zn-binding protein involved in type VI secretion
MAGVCVLGDQAEGTQPHVHGGGCCPHKIVGPSITATADVFINGIPALTLGDVGIHVACCGANTWQVIEASAGLFVNGSAAVRKGDKTLHCGISLGHMIQASGNVFDNSLASGPFGQGLLSGLTVTGSNVVAIPDGAHVIRDDLGNPIGWATYGTCDHEIGYIYDTRGNVVDSFPTSVCDNLQPDNSWLNPIGCKSQSTWESIAHDLRGSLWVGRGDGPASRARGPVYPRICHDPRRIPRGSARGAARFQRIPGFAPNPINLLTLPLGGVEKEGGERLLAGLKDLLSGAAKKGADAIPRTPAGLKAFLYDKGVSITHNPVSDGRPGPMPGALPPNSIGGAAWQVAKYAGKTAFQAWAKSKGLH